MECSPDDTRRRGGGRDLPSSVSQIRPTFDSLLSALQLRNIDVAWAEHCTRSIPSNEVFLTIFPTALLD